MTKQLPITYLILFLAPLVFSCHGTATEKNENKASAGAITLHVADENYVPIITQQSIVTWKGSSVGGSHIGYVSISKGEFLIEKDQLKGGMVEIDMTTIEDNDHRHDNNLIKHLKDADFFDVEKFSSSILAITKVAPINSEDLEVTGNLTIKGITHPVSFPAKVAIKDGMINANGRLVIDRTLWDIRYKSGKFFDTIKEQAIADSIEFNMKVVAKKERPDS